MIGGATKQSGVMPMFCWWLLVVVLALYCLALNRLNFMLRSWALYRHVERVFGWVEGMKSEKLGWVL